MIRVELILILSKDCFKNFAILTLLWTSKQTDENNMKERQKMTLQLLYKGRANFYTPGFFGVQTVF